MVPTTSCVPDDSKSVALLLQGQNLLVPIHAYPMLNHTQFPKRVDFGRCALGTRSSRHITMQCRIPIEFEFEVSWGHPVTEPSPLPSLISGHGSPSGVQAFRHSAAAVLPPGNVSKAQMLKHSMSDTHFKRSCCTDECLLQPLHLSISGGCWWTCPVWSANSSAR